MMTMIGVKLGDSLFNELGIIPIAILHMSYCTFRLRHRMAYLSLKRSDDFPSSSPCTKCDSSYHGSVDQPSSLQCCAASWGKFASFDACAEWATNTHAVAATGSPVVTSFVASSMVIGALGHGFFNASCNLTTQFFGPGTAPVQD